MGFKKIDENEFIYDVEGDEMKKKFKSSLLKEKTVTYAPHLKNFPSKTQELIDEIRVEILKMKNK
ncbi:hypothetical protein BACERE00183_03963 [Bacillus cereus]|nr:hypothetical protein BACERE00183_03963 [Bacillus cereus]